MNPSRVAALLREQARLLSELASEASVEGPPDAMLVSWAGLAHAGVQVASRPHVYFVLPIDAPLDVVKIGWTGGRTAARLGALQTGSPVVLGTAFTFAGPSQLESAMHARFAQHRRHGEWFAIDGDLAWLVGLSAQRLLVNHRELS